MSEVTFLIVEDDDIDAELVARAFKKLKIANPVMRARDGVEALDILRGSNGVQQIKAPYLILLDINMPRMSGLEFLGEVRSDPELRRSVIFMLTTSDDERDILRAYEQNIAGYVIKDNAHSSFNSALLMLDHYWRVVELPKS